MGCIPSKPVFIAISDLDHSYDGVTLTPPGSDTMPSATTPPTVHGAFTAQCERLLLEQLPFTNLCDFQNWLESPYVCGAWDEFRGDFLHADDRDLLEELDKAATCKLAYKALCSTDPKYRMFRPNKEGWTAQDHVARFIFMVVHDNFHGGVWSVNDITQCPKRHLGAVYEVLSYLRASSTGVDGRAREQVLAVPKARDTRKGEDEMAHQVAEQEDEGHEEEDREWRGREEVIYDVHEDVYDEDEDVYDEDENVYDEDENVYDGDEDVDDEEKRETISTRAW